MEALRVDPSLLARHATAPAPVPAAAQAPAVVTILPVVVAPSASPAATAAAPIVVAPTAGTATALPASGAVTPSPVVAGGVVPTPPARLGGTPSNATKSASSEKSWYRRLWDPVVNAYDNGTLEFYVPFETYHSRSSYSAEKIDTYQEKPLGFGVGKGLYNERGNWEGVYAMAFQDSHFKPSYTAGYGWKAMWRPADDVRVGLGYLAGLMMREDVISYVPFPILVPLASLSYKNFSVEGTFLPGSNVAFLWAKWELGKPGEALGTPARPVPPAEMPATAVAQTTPAAQRVPYGPTLATVPGQAPGAIPGTAQGAGTVAVASASAVALPQQATGSRADESVPDTQPPLALRNAKNMVPPPKDSAEPLPTFISALRMGGNVDREFNAEGDAELRKIGTVLTSDRLTYWPIDDEIEAEGNVRLEQGADVITGPKMRLKLEDQVGFFDQPSYTIKRAPQAGSQAAVDKVFAAESLAKQRAEKSWLNSGFASPTVLSIAVGQTALADQTKMPKGMTEGRGDADRIDFEGENQFRMSNATYTTCAPGNDDWYLKSADLHLDYDREVADGSDATLYFKDTPIIYSPWMSFSLNNERKSGFLAPSFGTSSNNGIELSLPYYWNIAPNMDATITPQVLAKRGTLLSGEARYLNTAYGGLYNSKLGLEVLPNDRLQDGDKRYAVSLVHTQAGTLNGFSGAINYTKVSDDTYYTDLSSSINSTSQVNLTQQGTLTYNAGWWDTTVNFLQYQTLQPDSSTVNVNPYRMLPQISFNARKYDVLGADATFLGQYTNFTKKEQTVNGVTLKLANGDPYPDGQRTVLYPQVSLPYVTPGWYVTPKVGVNVTNYALTNQAATIPDSINRTLPIFSVDSGMTFERPSNWFGRDYTQTLEPRLFYLNVPYKNQSQIPIFDTGLADFNFAQIFSENQFSSWDRVSNANQLTAAATTRLLEPETGNEIMRAMVGQRYYFEQNKVLLPSTVATTEKWEKSAWLAAFSGQVLPRVYVDSALQYDGANQEVDRFSIGTRYQPEPGKVLNLAYRYNQDPSAPIDQVDFSGQWPLGGGWHGVGRLNYSFSDDASNLATSTTSAQDGRMIQAIGGLEYNAGCWVVRGVVQRTALTLDSTSTGFFIQLELSGFSRIGSDPMNLLRRNIQGYSLINQPTATTVLGQ